MDIIKTCRTNVQLCENIFHIQCRRYELQEDTTERRSSLSRLIVQLRGLDALCTRIGHELWIFGDDDADVTQAIEASDLGLRLQVQCSTHLSSGGVHGRDAKDVLLESIESALSFKLARACNMKKIGPWRWLYVAEEQMVDGADALVLHLRIDHDELEVASYATTIVERRVISTQNSTLSAKPGSITIAPSGLPVSFVDLTHAGACGTGLISGDDWKAMVVSQLACEAIDISGETTSWLPVCLATGDDADSFLWPVSLCIPALVSPSHRPSVAGIDDWRSSFAPPLAPPGTGPGFKHPLTFAEEWFVSKRDREKAAAQALTAPSTDVLPEAPQPPATSGEIDSALTTSPPFVHRAADQQATMAGIYPTPEDSLMPPNTSQPPSSENISGPTLTEQNPLDTDMMQTNSDENPIGRQASSSDSLAFNAGNDDLFGDMNGEMEFGGGEVDDADFDFFNEDDNDAAAQDMDVDMTKAGKEPAEGHTSTDANGADEALPDRESSPAQLEHSREEEQNAMSPTASTTHRDKQVAENVFVTNEIPVSLQGRATNKPEKPLSPFGIKERLLPPPVPASARLASGEATTLHHRRRSAFDTVKFRDGLDLDSKYSAAATPALHQAFQPHRKLDAVDISLPERRKRPRLKRPSDVIIEDTDEDSESEEDSYESASSVSDHGLPPKLPWRSKKRKRIELEAIVSSSEFGRFWSQYDKDGSTDRATEGQMRLVLEKLLRLPLRGAYDSVVIGKATHDSPGDAMGSLGRAEKLSSVPVFAELSKLDLVYVAQLISEQAVSCLPNILRDLDNMIPASNGDADASAIQEIAARMLSSTVKGSVMCDITKLALTRDPQTNRTASVATQPRPGQPRPPPQRSESAPPGLDIVVIPPPYVRVKRGNDTYEMLPPALEFWDPLSLAPSNGPKDVRAFCVCPSNEDIQRLADTFLGELGGAYEHCKLGSHVHVRDVNEENDLDDFEDGLAPVQLDEEGDLTLEAALRAYRATCVDLGKFLASIGHLDTERDRTIVVYMLDCFPHQPKINQHLCACFWQLYKSYRDHIPKAARNQPRSDLVLQILPLEMVASSQTLIFLDAKQLGAVAKEVYDRCPPSNTGEKNITSALPNSAAPFVELISPPPKRIGFQLTAEAPSDLLHEASALHVAYAITEDRQWVVVCWTDNTGRDQSTVSLCLVGKTFAEVAEEIWDRTQDLMAVREVSWRIAIVTSGRIDKSVRHCWRTIVEKRRRQPYSVTLLTADLKPSLQLTPTGSATQDGTGAGSVAGAGFLTPVTTPSGSAMTVSPNASAHTAATNAPPTPASSESAAAAPFAIEYDAETHLVDLTDETWGVLFNPACTALTATGLRNTLASGALFQRGPVGNGTEALPGLKLDLLWTIQVRPNGNVDEGSSRHAEMTLREVVKMYRGLIVLAKARGLLGKSVGEEAGLGPVHLISAVKGAESLEGFLLR